MYSITRRDFLKKSAIATMVMLPCGMFVRNVVFAASLADDSNYYLGHREALLSEFQGVLKGASFFLEPEFGSKRTQEILQQAIDSYEKQLSEMPDVGGDKNWDTQFLVIAAWSTALYEALRVNGKTAEYVSNIIYELNRDQLEHMPKEKAQLEGEKAFSQESIQALREWAAWTQKRELKDNWVATFVEGDGQNFDYGIEYSECALVKYFNAQGVPELAPYICKNDFLKSRIYGTGLQRTKTIAKGDGHCNFRYKKGGPVVEV